VVIWGNGSITNIGSPPTCAAFVVPTRGYAAGYGRGWRGEKGTSSFQRRLSLLSATRGAWLLFFCHHHKQTIPDCIVVCFLDSLSFQALWIEIVGIIHSEVSFSFEYESHYINLCIFIIAGKNLIDFDITRTVTGKSVSQNPLFLRV
jgi:hypothetical protein